MHDLLNSVSTHNIGVQMCLSVNVALLIFTATQCCKGFMCKHLKGCYCKVKFAQKVAIKFPFALGKHYAYIQSGVQRLGSSESPTEQRSAVCFLMKEFHCGMYLCILCKDAMKISKPKNECIQKLSLHQSLECCNYWCILFKFKVPTMFSVCFAGSLLVQCSADGPSYHGRLCVPKMGPRSWLVHGPLLHDPHPRLHGLHVPHTQRHIQRGKDSNALKLNHGFPGWCNTVGFAQCCPFAWTESCILYKTSWFSLEYKYQVSLVQTQWP